MTEQEMISEMIKLQRKYDAAVYKEFDCEFNKEQCTLAMMDELGEFNHELKANWCYWKHTQKPVDYDKALEELADVWHFALSLTYHDLNETHITLNNKLLYVVKEGIEFNWEHVLYMLYDNQELSSLYLELFEVFANKLEILTVIGIKCGFSLKQVYEAYRKKNKINWERLANGY